MTGEFFVLLMFFGEPIALKEYTARESLSECLGAKRTIERNLYKDTGTVRYSCENKVVEINKGPDGKNYIVKIVE